MPTQRIELAAASVRKLEPDPDGDELFIRCTRTVGFGIRLKPSGVGSYFARYRIKGGRTRRVTIAKVTAMDLGMARTRARELIAAANLGRDTVADRREEGETARKAAEREARRQTLTL